MSDFKQENGRSREGPEAEAEQVGKLIRLAGRAPSVSDEQKERTKTVVLGHWRRETDRRSRRRRAWLIGGLAAAAMLIAAVGIGIRQGESWLVPPVVAAVQVERVADSVMLHADPGAPPTTVRSGDQVMAGSELATGDRGRVALRTETGHSVRLDSMTRLGILSGDSLDLIAGAVYVDSGPAPGAGNRPLEIHTPLGVVRDLGTQFEVRMHEDSLLLRVREGSASLDGPVAALEIVAGTEARIDAAGQVERRPISTFGPEWAWTGAVAPMIEIEGRTLGEFLDWVARERGLRIAFADPALAETAPGVTLTGSIDGFSLDQAIDAVLSTSGLRYRLDEATLVLSRAPVGAGL